MVLTSRVEPAELVRSDHEHLIHPLQIASEHAAPTIFVRGEGALLYDIQGNEYLDGLSCLWNVSAGHGRKELAEAAAEQMATLAFASNYVGSANVPAIRLAEKLSQIAYPKLNAVFFTSGGAESNEAAFKTARHFWKVRGRPDKVKVISRRQSYHGVTLAAMSATGLPIYHRAFAPLVPGFILVDPPYRFRCQRCAGEPACNLGCARAIEEAILAEGPETVAAVIGEPVQGAGGVIPPPEGYWPAVREICDRYEVLLIADEVITGFGRTGRWFALEHWGVQPDIMSFAKAVTSGYLPLGGIMVSDEIRDTINNAPPELRYMHAYTYSGHPTCCAVGLKNLEIFERERLVERAAVLGKRLLDGLRALEALPHVGEVRGLGMMAAVELVESKEPRRWFDPARQVGARVIAEAKQRGLWTRFVGDVVCLAPPLVATEAQIDRIVAILGEAIPAATR
jgi:adenosylmethionine-8-amino-7-oxononanoate aminotransferase